MNSQQVQRSRMMIGVLLAVLLLFAVLILNPGNGFSVKLRVSTDQGSDLAATQTAVESTIFAQATEILAEVTQTAAFEQTATTSAMRKNFAGRQTAVLPTLYAQATQLFASMTKQAVLDQTGTATALGTYSTSGPNPTIFMNDIAATQTAEMPTIFAQATQIIAGATQTEAINQTGTAAAIGTSTTLNQLRR